MAKKAAPPVKYHLSNYGRGRWAVATGTGRNFRRVTEITDLETALQARNRLDEQAKKRL